MKRWKKVVGITLVTLVVLLIAAISMTIGWRPMIGAKARTLTGVTFEPTPARLERGKYLAESIGCFGCHSEYDEKAAGVPSLVGKMGIGSVIVDEADFRVVAPNITPDPDKGIGKWTDDAVARAIREGVSHDGRALFPIMPYQLYRGMSDEDLASIVSYLRTVEPASSDLPKTSLPFPVSRLINTVPQPVTEPVPPPDMSTPVKRGEYLVRLGACADCHTPVGGPPNFAPIPGLEFSGGPQRGEVATTNITPDASGISYYDETLFLQAIRTGHVRARKLSVNMPWWVYRNMNDEDLKSVFAYLRTIPPAKHSIDNAEPPTDCKLCGNKHGFGDRN